MHPSIFVLYHANCMDGFGAAYAAWLALDDSATYIPVTHGHPFPEEVTDGSIVYILDFSYPADVLREVAARVCELTIIDHHKTAEEALRAVKDLDNIFISFALNKSGAVLTYEHFFPGTVPSLFEYIQDRDLWKFNYGDTTRMVHAGLQTVPKTFERWNRIDVSVLIEKGEVLLDHIKQTVQMICSQAREGEIGGRPCVMVNATAFWSEVGHKLLEDWPEMPFAASYYDDKHGRRIFSLRSRSGFDMSEVAKEFGGGGHAQAAGFTVSPAEMVGMDGL